MDFFDPDTTPVDGITKTHLLPVANKSIASLRTRVRPSMQMDPGSSLFGKSFCIMQVFIRRSLSFLEAGLDEFHQQRSMVTATCARANMENIAAFCHFMSAASPLLQTRDEAGYLELVDRRMFAIRDPTLLDKHPETLAVNILTQIAWMDKRHLGFKSDYDQLSEFVHPNVAGTAGHYLYFSDNRSVAHFRDKGEMAAIALSYLVSSAAQLRHMLAAIGELAEGLEVILAGWRSEHENMKDE